MYLKKKKDKGIHARWGPESGPRLEAWIWGEFLTIAVGQELAQRLDLDQPTATSWCWRDGPVDADATSLDGGR